MSTTYELVQQRVRYFHLMWPRAESAIYREVKRLAELGLATAESEKVGRRHRTVYSLTDEGLAALRDWLATPVSSFTMESEALIRIFMALRETRMSWVTGWILRQGRPQASP